jgi:pimeloyl-ACP methyl ester carboxylesterase
VIDAKWMRGLLALVAVLLLLIVGTPLAFRLVAASRERGAPLPAGSTLVPTNFGRVAVRVTGPAGGPAVLIVHGTAAWGDFWRDIARGLAIGGWRVVAVDLPPFGYSDRDAQARYDRVTQAARLADVLRAVAAQPAIVVGHSFGAGAATELALRHPGRVRRLVLVDAALGVLDPAPGRNVLARAMSMRLVGEGVTALTVTNPLATGALLRSFMARKDAATGWVPTIQRPMRRTGTTAAYAAWLPALFATDDGAWSRASARLAANRVPVSIIWGSADTVTPLDQGRRLATLLHADRFTILKDVGHIPHVEAPVAFAAALDQALRTGGR